MRKKDLIKQVDELQEILITKNNRIDILLFRINDLEGKISKKKIPITKETNHKEFCEAHKNIVDAPTTFPEGFHPDDERLYKLSMEAKKVCNNQMCLGEFCDCPQEP